MSYRTHEIAALIVAKPAEARAKILTAFVKGNASRAIAASLLGCTRGTFGQWVRKLNMREELRQVEKIARRNGWHHGRAGGAGCHRSRRESEETSDPF